MPTSQTITPDMSIGEAYQLLHPEGGEAAETNVYLSYQQDLSQDAKKQPGLYPLSRQWVVQDSDLAKMMAMNLSMLPVECIAIPHASPLFQNHYHELTATDDLSGQLTQYFPTYFVAALFEIQSLLQKAEIQGYVVGGIPRDLLLYQQKRFDLSDVDITVEGDALALARFLVQHSRNFCLAEEYPDFGTAKVYYRDTLILDIASTRQEIYQHAGALPTVIQRGVPLADDIIRRDFTCNALAFSINRLGEILDYTHGIEDIDARQIRVLHPVSLYEDPSRVFRALKFAVRFNFQLAEETQCLLENLLRHGALVYKGGGDRIKYELKSFLQARYVDTFTDQIRPPENPQEIRQEWLRFFLEKNCLQLANMELMRKIPAAKINCLLEVSKKISDLTQSLGNLIEKDYQRDFAFDIYLCFLLGDLVRDERENTFHRLGLTRQQRDAVEDFNILLGKNIGENRLRTLREFSSATEIYQIFHGFPMAAVAACILQTFVNEGESSYKINLEAFKTYKRKWEHLQLELDGNDLLELGVPSGKVIGDTLKALIHAKLSGRVIDRLSEIRFVQELLQKQATTPASPPEISSLKVEEL